MRRFPKPSRRLSVVALALAALLAVSGGVVLGVSVSRNGKAVTAVRTVTTSDDLSTNSRAWVDLPGMTTTVRVPATQMALLVITFSAVSTCTENGVSGAWCKIQILLDGNQVPPPVIFDSALDGNHGLAYEANSFQWVAGGVPAGLHTVKVQYVVDELESTFTIVDSTLTVLRSRQ